MPEPFFVLFRCTIFHNAPLHKHDGVAWWSYYDPAWQSIALWDITRLRLVGAPKVLHHDDADVQSAATFIVRRLV